MQWYRKGDQICFILKDICWLQLFKVCIILIAPLIARLVVILDEHITVEADITEVVWIEVSRPKKLS